MGKVTFKNGTSLEFPPSLESFQGSRDFEPHECQVEEFAASKMTKEAIKSTQIREMTDLEKFLDLYKSVGVEPEVEAHGAGTTLNLDNCLEGIDGYHGFYTKIYFDQNGKFLSQGIWE
ncbi:hypothetical protein [Salinimicrobium sp. WS361]|uniref:hypothetical protein n=1 Tax=Salinimicrobium sp. WS361 TaxID=3425123 RepID=UPI003D700791